MARFAGLKSFRAKAGTMAAERITTRIRDSRRLPSCSAIEFDSANGTLGPSS